MTVHVGSERKSNWTEIHALQEKQCIVILQLQIKDIFLKDSNLPNRPIFMDSKHKLKPKFLIHLDHLYSISVNVIGVHSSFADLLSIWFLHYSFYRS